MSPSDPGSHSVVALDGLELTPLQPWHAPQLLQLIERRGNRYLLDLGGASADQLGAAVAELAKAPWSLPMAILRDDYCVGMATTALANLRSLNASLTALFVDPPSSRTALALYLRHVFWNFPLTRLHTQIPVLDLTAEYLGLYLSAGFVDEGRLVGHAQVGGQYFDAAALGLLRTDFQQWCAEHEPRLVLG